MRSTISLRRHGSSARSKRRALENNPKGEPLGRMRMPLRESKRLRERRRLAKGGRSDAGNVWVENQ